MRTVTVTGDNNVSLIFERDTDGVWALRTTVRGADEHTDPGIAAGFDRLAADLAGMLDAVERRRLCAAP